MATSLPYVFPACALWGGIMFGVTVWWGWLHPFLENHTMTMAYAQSLTVLAYGVVNYLLWRCGV